MSSKPKLSVGVVSANLANLAGDLRVLENAGVDHLHLDVMDGHFVPMLLDGGLLLKTIKANTDIPIDVHLMTEKLEQNIAAYAAADMITVHPEASRHIHRAVQQIKTMGLKAGLALNPATPLTAITEILPELDLVLLLGINPGFPQQSFIAATTDKIKRLSKLRQKKKLSFEISVDGGVKLDNARIIAAAGADIIVSGSAIFKDAEIEKNISNFRKEFKQGLNGKGE